MGMRRVMVPHRAERPANESDLDDKITDPFNVYRIDTWNNLVDIVQELPPIHFQSPQLEFRGTLVKRLRNLNQKLKCGIATLHNAVDLLDRFMDSYSMQPQHLFHVAVVCLSIAAKSVDAAVSLPPLANLLRLADVKMTVAEFRQMELKVGENVKWRLLTPTPVSFAMILEDFIVMKSEMVTRRPEAVRKYRKDSVRLLNEYLDLTLSDVRLKAIQTVDVGCACVASARLDLGLTAWPAALATATERNYTDVVPVIRRLQRMKYLKQYQKSQDVGLSVEVNQPCLTPPLSPSVVNNVQTDTQTANTVKIGLTENTPPASPGNKQTDLQTTVDLTDPLDSTRFAIAFKRRLNMDAEVMRPKIQKLL